MLLIIFAAVLLACQAQAKAVFAHFMVTNAANYSSKDFVNDINLAKEAHIDAFALNMAKGDAVNDAVVSIFFDTAVSLDFQLFFSFDYAGNGPWPMNDVIDFINQYKSSSSYYHYNGQPFVSTFEGPGNASDWFTIKSSTGCFFIPDWSSVGAKGAMESGAADGLFSWAAWPWGNEDMNTYTDASYLQYLGDLPYMMPVSPWFYTNLPGFTKNWLWRGDNLWYDRWQEILYVQPPFVEIISWNDYGESHYIGPLRDYAMDAFSIGEASYNYATNMPHDGWRQLLPYLIDLYKTGTATITQENLVIWHRPQPAEACGTGGTPGNTASQLQLEFLPSEVVEDRIFYSALLASPASVTISIGGVTQQGSWDWKPDGGIVIYHGSVPFNNNLGDVTVTISRSGTQIAQVSGSSITTTCTNGLENWNAWVGYDVATTTISATPTLSLFDQKCINGTGSYNFIGLCEFSCEYGYCPISACTCQLQGAPKDAPNATGPAGYPLDGEDASYSGLCAFDCPHGYCPDTACGTVSAPLSTPTVSDFSPPACVAGTGEGNLAGLCSFACNYGYCPINACNCTAQGALNTLPPQTNQVGHAVSSLDQDLYQGLCKFSCQYGYCPEGACYATNSSTSSGSEAGSEIVYIDPGIFLVPSPVMGCWPPCTLVLPESTMYTETTIYYYTITTEIVLCSSTITDIAPSPQVTSVISFFNMPIDASQTDPFSFALTSSLVADPVTITAGTCTSTFYPNPVAIPSLPATEVEPDWVSLGTTVYVTGDTTQTFSEAQFTDYHSLASPTVITTYFPEVILESSSTSVATTTTTTVVPVWVQKGGFYWSPMPGPTPTPLDNPTLPEFPPIPTPPCFTLFDIFSIDCPPNKYRPTTTFRPETPQPTCTGTGCGKLCTANCETKSSSECSVQTATDYWVSCSGTSCSTTKTATITGCSVTNSVTTTGQYCPAAITLDPNEDQGEDGPSPTATVMITTTIPEIGVVGGTPYPVSSGSIVVNGVPLAIPVVTGNEVSTTISRQPVVIVPGYVGEVPSIVLPNPSSATSVYQSVTTTTLPDTTITVTPTPSPTSYDCKGSSLCGSYLDLSTYCKEAIANLNSTTIYGTIEGDSGTGDCEGPEGFGGCGVFVQGTNCEFTGDEIRDAANNTYNTAGCGICGNAWFSNGCRVTINYVSGCTTA